MGSVPSIEKWSSLSKMGFLPQCKVGGVCRVDGAMAMFDAVWLLPRSDDKKTVYCVLSMMTTTKMISRWGWTESVRRKTTALRQYRSITLPNLHGDRKGTGQHDRVRDSGFVSCLNGIWDVIRQLACIKQKCIASLITVKCIVLHVKSKSLQGKAT